MAKTTKKPKPSANGAVAQEVLTLAEAAAWLRVPEAGLQADAVAGRIPARLVAGEWRFNRPAVLAWLSVPEPDSRPKTGAELVARIREINARNEFHETPEETEAFIAEVYAARKARG